MAAEGGRSDAQLALAKLYENGKGVARDPVEAERWYAAAAGPLAAEAGRGDARAQEEFGKLLVGGRGVPQDVNRGVALLEAAAKQGRTSAQVQLGKLFAEGSDGVAPDPTAAARYYELAAQQGNSGAQYELAKLYAEGRGVPQDGMRAISLFQQAAAQGKINAYARIGDLYASGDGDGIVKDYGEAVRWYDEAARNGDAKGLYRLGEAYEQGRGVEADPVRALMWYSLAAEEGYEAAPARVDQLAGRLAPEQKAQAQAQAAEWQRANGAP